MITNIINPLLQAVSFISIWYLYQTMSKIKPLRGHLLLLFLSYVAAASYFSLVKNRCGPAFLPCCRFGPCQRAFFLSSIALRFLSNYPF